MKRKKVKKTKRIKKPTVVKTMMTLPEYNMFNETYDNCGLKKWCIEQAAFITKGNCDTANVITDAQKIFDWVTK